MAILNALIARSRFIRLLTAHPITRLECKSKIAALADSLNNEATKSEAIVLLRGLVTEARMIPETTALNGHIIELTGDLAAILELSDPQIQKTRRLTGGGSVSLVAGVGFEPTTFRL